MTIRRNEKRRRQCPRCGSEKVARILYGLPTEEARDLADKGKVALGGCLVSSDNPRWRCADCEHDW